LILSASVELGVQPPFRNCRRLPPLSCVHGARLDLGKNFSPRGERVGAAHAPHVGASAAFVLHGLARVIVAFSRSPRAFCSRVP